MDDHVTNTLILSPVFCFHAAKTAATAKQQWSNGETHSYLSSGFGARAPASHLLSRHNRNGSASLLSGRWHWGQFVLLKADTKMNKLVIPSCCYNWIKAFFFFILYTFGLTITKSKPSREQYWSVRSDAAVVHGWSGTPAVALGQNKDLEKPQLEKKLLQMLTLIGWPMATNCPGLRYNI